MPRPSPRLGRLLGAAAVATGLCVGVGVVTTTAPAARVLDLADGPAELAYLAHDTTYDAPADALSDRLDDRGFKKASDERVKLVLRAQHRADVVARQELIASLPPYKILRPRHVIELTPPKPLPITFQIGTLNILGSQHAPNGDGRAAELAGAIIGRGVDVVGLQEVQDDQLAVLDRDLPGYDITPDFTLGHQGLRLQIAFRSDMFQQVDSGHITSPFDHQQVPTPYILLKDRVTGGEFWVIDIHNAPRDQQDERNVDKSQEIGLVHQLQASGKPVFLVGDSNEHTEFSCEVMAATGMVSSGGGYDHGSGCNGGASPVKIDWILGSGDVSFSGHDIDYDAPIPSATDHSFVHATVTVVPPAADPSANR